MSKSTRHAPDHENIRSAVFPIGQIFNGFTLPFRQQQGKARTDSILFHSIVQLFNCSNIQMFSCSLFFCSYYQRENKSFHPDRAPHRNSDHRDSGGNAAAGIESGPEQSQKHLLPEPEPADIAKHDGVSDGLQ